MKKEEIKIRCSYSRKGIDTFNKNRRGYVIGENRDGSCWYVLWDYLKQKQVIHKDFIYIELEE